MKLKFIHNQEILEPFYYKKCNNLVFLKHMNIILLTYRGSEHPRVKLKKL